MFSTIIPYSILNTKKLSVLNYKYLKLYNTTLLFTDASEQKHIYKIILLVTLKK